MCIGEIEQLKKAATKSKSNDRVQIEKIKLPPKAKDDWEEQKSSKLDISISKIVYGTHQ